MLLLLLSLDLIVIGCRFFRNKTAVLGLSIVSLLSCMSLQAESVGMESHELLVILPRPELPLDFLMELPLEVSEDTPEREETMQTSVMAYLELNRESAGENPPSRPLRITPYTLPVHLLAQTQNARAPVMQGMIPGLDQPMTQEYIARYSNPKGIEWLDTIMRRGSSFFAFIRKEIEVRKLPPELMYLPVIESAFVTTAVSRSGATGLWQFMRNSIAPYDMKVTDWMDERMDFWKSTLGALSKLEENYRQLGDWALALAAYNTGLGGLNRTMQRTGIRDYWTLSEKKHLTTETIHYVPKLLAISYIMSNHRYFGIDPLWPEDPEWTRIRVDRTVDLELLADEAGIDKQELKRANGELFYHVTPPDSTYHLKIRTADLAAIAAVLEREDIPLIKYYFHTIISGDTLSGLAKHYGVSVDHILKANPRVEARYLKIGSRILIPAYKTVVPSPKMEQPNTEITVDGTHLVKQGETLWSIARAYQVSPEALAAANGMGLNDVLREGRRLKTPIR